MTDENKALAKRWLNDLWGGGDYALVHELHASDYVRYDSPFPINNPDDYLRFIKVSETPSITLRSPWKI